MKVKEPCRACLAGLVNKTVSLSGNDERVRGSSLALLESVYDRDATPPAIANVLLDHIRRMTGVYDPYATIKYRELRQALLFTKRTEGEKRASLYDLIRLSALGNSTDFFTGGSFDTGSYVLAGDIGKAEKIILNGGKEILMLGDNMGDFVCDAALARFLEERGKKVFYAVKGGPVQNDISAEDVARHGLEETYSSIVSTGVARVGLARDDMTGTIGRLWKDGAPVIAKGMGNFETISEFDDERQVVYIMKVKCPAVAHAVKSDIGTYIVYMR
jgi:damage-control phosphatase, subfamily I